VSSRPFLPTDCPVCATSLEVTRLRCPACETGIDGRFSLGALGALGREQLAFVEAFVLCRGKIKDVEAQLGISYPTVVARLDEVVARMAGAVRKSAPRPERERDEPARDRDRERARVLEDVAARRLDAREGAARLRKLAARATEATVATATATAPVDEGEDEEPRGGHA
jgi:hypothetical protein